MAKYTGTSVVDYLNSVGKPSDYASRAATAAQLGISNYTGTADQNTRMLALLQGSLPTMTESNSAFMSANPQYGYNGQPNPTTITPAMNTSFNTSSMNQSLGDLVQAVQTGQMTQEQAYQTALSRLGGNPGGTTSQQQLASQIRSAIYSVSRTSTPVTTSVTGGAGTNSSTTMVAPGGAGNAQGGTVGGTGSSATLPGGMQSTGDQNLDAILGQYGQIISGSLAQGFTVNPGLNITPDVLSSFIASAHSQLDPKYQQYLSSQMNSINSYLSNAQVNYENTQGQTQQDFQTNIAAERDATGNQGVAFGGARRLAEQNMALSANRTLSTNAANTAYNVGQQLNAAGAAIGQGIPGVTIPEPAGAVGLSNNYGLNSYAINAPILSSYGVSTSGARGSTSTGSPLNFNFNPSMYQYGSIPGSYGSDFLSQLNQNASNYQAGQTANSARNIQGLGITNNLQ